MTPLSSALRETHGTPAVPPTAHLLRAERQIALIRASGLVLWALVLGHREYDINPPHPAWLVYAGGVIYALALHWLLTRGYAVHARAWSATVGDPLLAVIMCSVTGGLSSVFIPFCHFTLLAAAFRFGVAAALLVLGMNSLLLIVMGVASGAPAADIALVVAYLCFSAVFGVMLAGWARDNEQIALDHGTALRRAQERLRALLGRYFSLTEEQRKQFAGELHDRMGGQLFTIQQRLDQLAAQEQAHPARRAELARLATSVRACAADVRNLMNDLRPTVLDDFGLWEALREHLARSADELPFTVSLAIDAELERWRSPHEALLFRLLQEAVLNVRKHAGARHVRIAGRRHDASVILTVADDGQGFAPVAVTSGHYGLLTMRERAEAIGGSCDVDSTPGRGTTVRVIIPAEVDA